jgi:hypothetical protein
MLHYKFSLDGQQIISNFITDTIGADNIAPTDFLLNDDLSYKVASYEPYDSLSAFPGLMSLDSNFTMMNSKYRPTYQIEGFSSFTIGDQTFLEWREDSTTYYTATPTKVRHIDSLTWTVTWWDKLTFQVSNTETDSVLFGIILAKDDTISTDGASKSMLSVNEQEECYMGGTANCADICGFPEPIDNWYALYKLDANANLLWEKYYGGDQYYHLSHVVATKDGGCLMVGETWDYHTNPQLNLDIKLIKIGPDGTSINENNGSSPSINIYPNPANTYFYIEGAYSQGELSLFDMYGRLVKKQILYNGYGKIEVSTLAKGLYVYQFNSEGKLIAGKVAVE